jgi:hypothetical protein
VVRRGQFTPVVRDRFCAQEFGLTLSAALVEVIEVRPRMPIVSKQQLALSLGMATATIDRWIARAEQLLARDARQAAIRAIARG